MASEEEKNKVHKASQMHSTHEMWDSREFQCEGDAMSYKETESQPAMVAAVFCSHIGLFSHIQEGDSSVVSI